MQSKGTNTSIIEVMKVLRRSSFGSNFKSITVLLWFIRARRWIRFLNGKMSVTAYFKVRCICSMSLPSVDRLLMTTMMNSLLPPSLNTPFRFPSDSPNLIGQHCSIVYFAP
jgi:hypothetical protein